MPLRLTALICSVHLVRKSAARSLVLGSAGNHQQTYGAAPVQHHTAPVQMLLVRFIMVYLHTSPHLAWASWASTFASNVRHKWSWCLAIFSNTSEQEGAALSQELKLNNEILARNVFCKSIQLGLTLIGFNRIHIRIIMELVMAAFAESRISSPWGCMIVHGMHTCEGPRSTPVLRVITASASRSRVVTASLAP